MNEVLQKLFFVLIAISFFHSGCVTTPTTNETNQFTEPNKRISFSNEGFSIERPPDDWVMMKPKPVELARWQQRVTSSAILIGATINPQLNLSKSAWAKLSINVTKIQLEDFSEYCEVINAKEEEIVFKGQEFYQISAVIKCTDFRGDMGKVLVKELSMKVTHVFSVAEDMRYSFALFASPEFYDEGQVVLYNLLKSFTFLGGHQYNEVPDVVERLDYRNYGQNSLIDAVTTGDIEKVKELLDYGTKVNSRNSIGNTALIYASANGYDEIVETLIAYGAEVNVKGQNGATALFNACLQGHTRIVKILLDANANVNIRGDKGYSPLLAALVKDDLESAKNLINAGADVNSTTVYGYTPLMCASSHGHYYIAKLLIDRGALVNAREEKAEQSSLVFASGEGGHKLLVELLMDSGANVNERDKFGWTPLMRAAQYGRLDVIKLLLDDGADINAINNYGWNALMIAIEKGHKEVVKLLKAAGAKKEVPTGPLDISMRDYSGDYMITKTNDGCYTFTVVNYS